MPSLWLILGAIGITSVYLLIDRLLVRPRSRTVVVDGKEVVVRRRRDSALLMAVMAVMYIGLGAAGAAIEGSLLLLALIAIPFAVIMMLSLVRAVRASEPLPVEVEREIRAGGAVAGRLYVIFALLALGAVLTGASNATDGLVSIALIVGHWVSVAVVLWLFWRVWQVARAIRGSDEVG